MKKILSLVLIVLPILAFAAEPAVYAVKYNHGANTENEGTYYVYTCKNNQYRLDYLSEYNTFDENDNYVTMHDHEVFLSRGGGQTPMKYEDSEWSQSQAAPQEIGNTWASTIKDLTDLYVKYSGFTQAGTATIAGKNATCYKGIVKKLDTSSDMRMVGYSVLNYETGNPAEIYVWNGITLRIVVDGKCVFEVLEYTENIPDAALTQTLNVTWVK